MKALIPIVAVIVISTLPTFAAVIGRTNAATQELPASVTLCDILADIGSYVGRTITLSATLVSNEEFSAFTDTSCRPRPAEVDSKHPLVAPSFNAQRYNLKSPLNKKLSKLLKKHNQARVIVRGVFIDPGHFFGHQLCCRYKLDIHELLAVEPIKSSEGRR